MAATAADSPLSSSFASLVEQLMFGLVPAGLAILATPLLGNGFRQMMQPRRASHLPLKAFLPVVSVLLALQLVATALWRVAPFAPDSSFPAAALSLLASLSVSVVLRLEMATAMRPLDFPLYLLTATLLYDITASWHGFTLGHLYLPKVQCAIAATKVALIAICDSRQNWASSILLSLINYADSFLVQISTWMQHLLMPLSRLQGASEPRILYGEFMRCWKPDTQPPRTSITSACVRVLYWQHVWYLCVQYTHISLTIAQPFLFKYIMATAGQSDITKKSIILPGLYISMVVLVQVLLRHAAQSFQNRILVSAKSILITAVHHKLLRLSFEEVMNTPTKSILTHDVDVAVGGLRGAHGLLRQAFGIPLALFTLYHLMGEAVLVLIITIPTLSLVLNYVERSAVSSDGPYIECRDARIDATISVITQLKNIKMMGLTGPMLAYLERKCTQEVRANLRRRIYSCAIFSLTGFAHSINPVLALGTAWYYTQSLSDASIIEIFQILMPLSLLTEYFTQYMGNLFQRLESAPALASLSQFLILEELDAKHSHENRDIPLHSDVNFAGDYAIQVVDITLKSAEEEVLLQDVNFNIARNTVAMLSGSVGCGKTTLLRALLGEIKATTGSIIKNNGIMAYCAQKTWIPALTIRQIILGGQCYVQQRYMSVLVACCLDIDLLSWPSGDSTSAKSSASVFTRSLRQRLAIARALYAQASIILLDDAMSSVDSVTAEKITKNLFGPGGLLRTRDCTVVTCTNNRDQLRYADVIFEINDDFEIWEHKDLRSLNSSAMSDSDVQIEADVLELNTSPTLANPNEVSLRPTTVLGTANNASYLFDRFKSLVYFMEPAGWRTTWIWFAVVASAAALQDGIPIFLSLTFSAKALTPVHFAELVALGLFSVLWIAGTGWLFYRISGDITEKLFSKLVRTAMSATPEFLAATDLPYLLRLFRDDFQAISNDLDSPFMEFSYHIFSVTSGLVLVSLSVHYGIVVATAIALFCVVIQPAYSAMHTHLVSLKERAYAKFDEHLGEMGIGIEHIRAFGLVAPTARDGQTLISEWQKYEYCTLQAKSRASLVCEALGAFALFTVVVSGLMFADETPPSVFGLALFYIIYYGNILSILLNTRTATELQLDRVSRIRRFCSDTPMEVDGPVAVPSSTEWPTSGELEFQHTTVTSSGGVAQLPGHTMKDMNIWVEPGEKVGLVGYPDHGQSSVIHAVLRMVDYTGDITIDGRDIKSISRELLRSKITTITEDGIAVSGSVRLNLDPYSVTDDHFSDGELINMLTRVRLWNIVSRRGGLDGDISRMRFSRGHLQLLNLARGALHKRRASTKIVLIDEATSTMDVDTEFQMSDFMDGEFAGATVLIVAQRLQCFETADTVLMIQEGRVDSILRQDEDTGEWHEEVDNE